MSNNFFFFGQRILKIKVFLPRSSFNARGVLLLCMLNQTAILFCCLVKLTPLISSWHPYFTQTSSLYIEGATEILIHQITSFT